jgi:flagellar hook-associated protein 2
VASSVDGLVSGLSTTALIGQLMQVEAVPQTALKTKVTSEQTVQSALRSVNTKFAALKTAAHALRVDDALQSSVWKGTRPTSSAPDALTASTTDGATAGEVTVSVTHLARASVVTAALPASGPVTDAGKVHVKIGTADPVEIEVATDTPEGLAEAINAKGLAVKAAVVTADQGKILQLTSTNTGVANAVSLTGPPGVSNGGLVAGATVATAVGAQDARIKVGSGDPVTGGYTISSGTNTFTSVLPGVTMVAAKVQDNVTITVTSDTAGAASKMQDVVDAANAALAEIAKYATYDATNKKAGPLLSDSLMRSLQQQVLGAVTGGATDFGSFKQLGLETNRSGRLTFDRGAFVAAVQKKPDAVKNAVGQGLAVGLEDIATKASNSVDGTITLAIKARDGVIRDLNTQVSNWDIRLSGRRKALERQFSNLEVALGKLKDQSNWLAGQLASLPSGSG